MAQDYAFRKIRLTLRLKTTNYLHIGDGTSKTDQKIKDAETEKAPEVIQVCCDHKQYPYLPGSSLKGFVRRIAENLLNLPDTKIDRNVVLQLFGASHTKGVASDITTGSLLFENAYLHTEPGIDQDKGYVNSLFVTRVHNRIHPVLGSAQHTMLFARRYVKPGVCFELTVKGDKLTEKQYCQLKEILSYINGGALAGLGKGFEQGLGNITIEQCSDKPVFDFKTLPKCHYIAWLHEQKITKLDKHWVGDPDFTLSGRVKHPGFYDLRLNFQFLSPLLTYDPSTQQTAATKTNRIVTRTEVIQETAEGALYCLEQASAVQGRMRSRLGRIVRTIVDSYFGSQIQRGVVINAEQRTIVSNKLIESIFGNTEMGRKLVFGDIFHEKAGTDFEYHHQPFTAIDRFTGGPLDGALFSVQALDFSEPFPSAGGQAAKPAAKIYCTVRLDKHLWSENAIDDPVDLTVGGAQDCPYPYILLCLLRDLMEGDVMLGQQNRVNFGACRVSLTYSSDKNSKEFQHWDDVVKWLEPEAIIEWRRQLLSWLDEQIEIMTPQDCAE